MSKKILEMNAAVKKKILEILLEQGDLIQSPDDVLLYLRQVLEDRLLDSMTEAELEKFGEIVFEELLELIAFEERREQETKNQMYN